MGIVIAFVVGWFMGSHGGESEYDDVVEAAQAVRKSDEFATLTSAVRSHTATAMRQAADWLQAVEGASSPAGEFIERVRSMVSKDQSS